jgi:hypothetical protein
MYGLGLRFNAEHHFIASNFNTVFATYSSSSFKSSGCQSSSDLSD